MEPNVKWKMLFHSHQRIFISDRRDSTRYRLTKIWLTQPLSPPALSDGQVVQHTADRAGSCWVSQIDGGCCPFYHWVALIYFILFRSHPTGMSFANDFPDANEDQGEEASNHIQDLII